MSLYRQAGGRPWALVAVALVAGVAIGVAIGLLIGGGNDKELTLAEQVADLRTDAQPLRLALEQVAIEYTGTVSDGEVESPTEYQAAQATVARAIASFDQLRADLEALNPAAAERLDRALVELSDLVDHRASEGAVDAQVAEAERALAAAIGDDQQPGS
jgi:uncharacterized membrane-anchored protein YhcB (DUF1043 family)